MDGPRKYHNSGTPYIVNENWYMGREKNQKSKLSDDIQNGITKFNASEILEPNAAAIWIARSNVFVIFIANTQFIDNSVRKSNAFEIWIVKI